MEHVGHWRVDLLHRRAGTRRAIGGAVRKFAAYWPCITKLCEGAANVSAAQAGVVGHQHWSGCGPAELFYEFAWQTKRKVKRTDPAIGFIQPTFKGLLGSDANFIAVRCTAPEGRAGGTMNLDSDPKNPHSIFESWTRPLRQLPSAMTIGFWRLGALEKSHPTSSMLNQLWPTMEAVAINSSSKASNTLPDTEYGSNTGVSEYFSKIDVLSLAMLTWPMVQPE